jgi:ATP-dependent DNA helicase RecG
MSITKIINQLREIGAEFEDVEVKAATGGLPESLLSTMSAFANTRGGLVVLGIDERTGFSAVGVREPSAMRDAVVDMAREKLTPALRPSVDIVSFEGTQLVVAEVMALDVRQQPCYVKTRGEYNGSYVRTGDGDHRLSVYELDRLRENSRQPRWDEEPASEATVDDLDPLVVVRLIAQAKRRSDRAFIGLTDEEVLLRLKILVRAEGKVVPSLAGLLAAGLYPQEYFANLMISFVVYPFAKAGKSGPGGERFLDNVTLTGSIPDMLNGALGAIQRNLKVSSTIIGAGREDRWEIDLEVIREAIVNALMHRDYSPHARGTQVQIELYSDRLVVKSPGGVFGNIDMSMLGLSGTSSSRNNRLSFMLQDVGELVTGRPIAENRGSGVSMMVEHVREWISAPPIFLTSLNEFTVIIPRADPVTEAEVSWLKRIGLTDYITPPQRTAIVMARAGYDIDNAFFRRLGMSGKEASVHLQGLLDMQVLCNRNAREDGPYRFNQRYFDGLEQAQVSSIMTSRHWRLDERPSTAARVLALLDVDESISRGDVQTKLGLSRAVATRALNELIEDGLVEPTAPLRSKSRRYRRLTG